jgi:hypothetical protein
MKGTAATLIALFGSTLQTASSWTPDHHSWLTDLHLTVIGGERSTIFWIVRGPVFGGPGVWWAHTVSIVPALIVGSFFDVKPGIRLAQGGGDNFGNP